MAIPFSYFQDGVKIAKYVYVLTMMASQCFINKLDNGTKDENEVSNLSQQELRWLPDGLSL